MSQLSQIVLALTERAKANPAVLSDPRAFAALERAAKEDQSSRFAASHAPIAEDTVEIKSRLAETDASTGWEAMTFERPVEIVGFIPTLCDEAAPGGNRVMTVADIDVSVRVDTKSTLTQGQGSQSAGGTSTVSLAAISILVPRLFLLTLAGAAPRVEFQFSSKLGAGVFRRTRIGLAAAVNYLD